MDDYDKRKLERLENLERNVRSAIDYFSLAIKTTWFVGAIGLPTLIFLAPVKEERTLQAVLLFMVIAFLFGLAKADKALGKLK